MSESLTESVKKLPPWVIPAVAVLLLAFALLRRGGSGGGSNYGLVRAYEPVPSDPGAIQLAATEINARGAAFSKLVDAVSGEEISRLAVSRDLALAGVQRDISLSKFSADLESDRISTGVAERLGLATVNRDVTLGMRNADVAASLGLADIQSRNYLADISRGLGLAELETRRYATDAATEITRLQTSAASDLARLQTSAGLTAQERANATAIEQQRSGQKSNLWSDIINGGIGLLRDWFRGRNSSPQPSALPNYGGTGFSWNRDTRYDIPGVDYSRLN